jgi:hypothetical protein
MEVNETDYKRCNSSHPNFFSNTGNTVFRFDYSGPFYFISGVSGHCEKGQRMIVKVMSPEEEPPSGIVGLPCCSFFVCSLCCISLCSVYCFVLCYVVS